MLVAIDPFCAIVASPLIRLKTSLVIADTSVTVKGGVDGVQAEPTLFVSPM
jgi:hypothetical protein